MDILPVDRVYVLIRIGDALHFPRLDELEPYMTQHSMAGAPSVSVVGCYLAEEDEPEWGQWQWMPRRTG